ncbi:hypothetical protein [Frankia sp. AiPa1]|nr:hypothetical protein [Frankia sp. AiPa1]
MRPSSEPTRGQAVATENAMLELADAPVRAVLARATCRAEVFPR